MISHNQSTSINKNKLGKYHSYLLKRVKKLSVSMKTIRITSYMIILLKRQLCYFIK